MHRPGLSRQLRAGGVQLSALLLGLAALSGLSKYLVKVQWTFTCVFGVVTTLRMKVWACPI